MVCHLVYDIITSELDSSGRLSVLLPAQSVLELPELLLFHGTSSLLDWALDLLIMISATEIPIYIALFVIPHDMHRLKWFLHIKWTF